MRDLNPRYRKVDYGFQDRCITALPPQLNASTTSLAGSFPGVPRRNAAGGGTNALALEKARSGNRNHIYCVEDSRSSR